MRTKNEKQAPLSNAEEQLMSYLWKLEKAFFKELMEQYTTPKPATTTVNTLLKRTIDKKYVSYLIYGNSRQYYPLVSRNEYFSKHIRGLIKQFFNGSIEQFASFFTQEIEINDRDLKKLRDLVNRQLKESHEE